MFRLGFLLEIFKQFLCQINLYDRNLATHKKDKCIVKYENGINVWK